MSSDPPAASHPGSMASPKCTSPKPILPPLQVHHFSHIPPGGEDEHPREELETLPRGSAGCTGHRRWTASQLRCLIPVHQRSHCWGSAGHSTKADTGRHAGKQDHTLSWQGCWTAGHMLEVHLLQLWRWLLPAAGRRSNGFSRFCRRRQPLHGVLWGPRPKPGTCPLQTLSSIALYSYFSFISPLWSTSFKETTITASS